jgi:regulator of sirC expression with transglutaminase-like and TPR domain
VISERIVHAFSQAALAPDPDLTAAALLIARVEYTQLDDQPYVDRLDVMGREARRRMAVGLDSALPGDAPPDVDPERHAQVLALNHYLFHELRFSGNEAHYEDPRNSFLNEVLDRRTGIPITLAVLYMEVARRAGLPVEGINFPGHFLLRCPARFGTPYPADLVIDPFHGGALLSREMLRRQAASVDLMDDLVPGESRLLPRATKPQILSRMLINLKRIYVRMLSFPQARDITQLLIAVDPSAINEMRDRGLLAYHLKDFSGALRDLSTYLALSATSPIDEDDRSEHEQIWEHVKTLRRRVASFN